MEARQLNRNNRAAYERIAVEYAGPEPSEEDPQMREALRGLFCERLQGVRVLEVGCGSGADSNALHQRGLMVTATDFCETLLQITHRRYPHLQVAMMDMTRPCFTVSRFDGIYSAWSFIHLPREMAAPTLRQLARILRPDGVLFLTLINSTRVREYSIEDWGGVQGNRALFTCYSEDDMGGLLRDAGFGRAEFHHLSSPVYQTIPRLVERAVSTFQAIAHLPGCSATVAALEPQET